ncbi:MAG: hypothetical protein UU48_C0017G0020 [Candidatus Uhrbacteria bacterium GW2011_GWF2_41_16]|uniref:DUF1640 domain-containing protein n=1 Tax=Candidatus Uhrbacteria bacterium GW2011_GWF2_41_16 TaxID=1618997 RepID=A0A0G0V8U7_9BACT|nr:MAG: hypothetical protein UU48_C0017G0020 [Candidatus Uhrbacteria bacterium GW2011_GWF2_41_16]OHB86399.1 MAG: hypothetical protein A3D13_07430 [Planctomycetes bacterium RIFCSPHIGHO2_02_FULL_40_12]
MSITRELENLKKLESVGFSHEQAETLADVIEKSHVDSQKSLKEFIHNELHNEINNLRVEISRELKDMLIKIFGIIVGTVGVAVTILKLFP